MKNYLIREPSLREEIEGSITRSITRYDLRTTYGISDSWNISLNIPFVEINQNSTISPLSGASASAQELADLLQTRTIQGVGDVELTSLHRPLFSDWNALVWGYGFTIPGESQTEPYVDATSLQLGEPAPMAFGFVHYTRFTALPRSRFDFRPFVRHMFSAPVTVASGETRRLEPVNRLSVKFDWSQELGNFVYGLGAEFMGQGEHTINGERLVDQVRGQIVRTRIGYGNMAGLEDGPQSFSYQLQLEFRSVLRAANIPHGDHMTLSILTFF